MRALGEAGIDAEWLVTAMHLDPNAGLTVVEVRTSGYRIAAEVECSPPDDTHAGMADAVGLAIRGMVQPMTEWGAGWVVLLGDRGEQLAAAIVATHLGMPIAHLHGGERTYGAIDDTTRDLVSRMAHLHLVATADAALRLAELGEDQWRVHKVGAPGLDDLADMAEIGVAEVRARYGLPANGPFLLVVQHAETRAKRDSGSDIAETLDAIRTAGLPALIVLPNTDAGGAAIRSRLTDPGLATAVSLPRPEFAVLLRDAAALVGNSSSGLIEAPLLGTPAVNIGGRQAGRTRGENVIDVAPDSAAISEGIRRAMDPTFRSGLRTESPYGDGHASDRIAALLAATPIDERLLLKVPG
jgi:UDP-hydrolysing UDP-N-acetyl-D-glucosamine 2-epimerase